MLLEAAVNGEDQILVGAINIAEARLAHPFQLILERRRAIELHPLESGRQVAIVDTQFAHPRYPPLMMELVSFGSRAAKLLSVDEYAIVIERAVDSLEQRALLLVAQVMDRQRRNDCVVLLLDSIDAVVGDFEAEARARQFETRACALEHLVRDVDHRDPRIRETVRDKRGHQSSARAEIEHLKTALARKLD